MDDTTTTDKVEEQPSGATINGVPVDEQGNAIAFNDDDVVAQPEATSTVAADVQTEGTQPEAQASVDSTDVQTPAELEYLKNKGIDPTSPDALTRAAALLKKNDQDFHSRQAQTKAAELEQGLNALVDPTPTYSEPYGYTETAVDPELQVLKQKVTYMDFYGKYSDAKDPAIEAAMVQVAKERPSLNQPGNPDLDSLYELAKARVTSDPALLEKQLRDKIYAELAQKSAASLPQASASTATPSSSTLTPANLDAMVAAMSQQEYESRIDEIRAVQAM